MKRYRFLFFAAAYLNICGLFFCAGLEAASKEPREKQRLSYGRIGLVKFSNGHWRMTLDGMLFTVKGMEYSVDIPGTRPEQPNGWMKSDINRNGRIDGPYDSWVDANRNNVQDPGEHPSGDFKLLKDMGCNTIRIYHPQNVNKQLLRSLYNDYGIYVIMGNFLGAYTVGSGAEWAEGTDYTNKEQKNNMKENIKKMVEEFQGEPYILMWMLGNENDVEGSPDNSTLNNTNAAANPKAYASFVGEVSKMIKKMDPNHPVAVCNGGFKLLPYFKKYAPQVDIIGMNSYSGAYGFGTLWNRVKVAFDRPVLVTEYGCDSYNLKKEEIDEDFQAQYHAKAWRDIGKNSIGGPGIGNALGGVVFCWLDKWWICGGAGVQDTDIGAWDGPTNDGSFQDEWMGVCGQGDGSASPFLRQPKKVYYLYKNELWKN